MKDTCQINTFSLKHILCIVICVQNWKYFFTRESVYSVGHSTQSLYS